MALSGHPGRLGECPLLGVKRTSPSRLASMFLAAWRGRAFNGTAESLSARLVDFCGGNSSQLAGVDNPVAITQELHRSRSVHEYEAAQVFELNGAQGRSARIHANQTHKVRWETPNVPCVSRSFGRHVSHQDVSCAKARLATGSQVLCAECGQRPRAADGRLGRCIPCIKAEAARARDAHRAADARVSKPKPRNPRTENV
jgi:hypothetical protein